MTKTGVPHPEPALLRAIDEGVVPEEVACDVRAHLAECAICVQLRDDLGHLAESPLVEDRLLSRPLVFLRRRSTLWALAAVAAALVFLVMRRPAPVVEPVKPPTLVAYRLPLEAAPLRLPLESAITLRGAPNASSSYLAALGAALEPYRKRDFANAAAKLRALGEAYPRAVEPLFYQGVSLLLAGDAHAALAPLQQAQQIGGEALKEEFAWYLAIAYERRGEWELAKPLIERVCKSAGQHRGAACEALSR